MVVVGDALLTHFVTACLSISRHARPSLRPSLRPGLAIRSAAWPGRYGNHRPHPCARQTPSWSTKQKQSKPSSIDDSLPTLRQPPSSTDYLLASSTYLRVVAVVESSRERHERHARRPAQLELGHVAPVVVAHLSCRACFRSHCSIKTQPERDRTREGERRGRDRERGGRRERKREGEGERLGGTHRLPRVHDLSVAAEGSRVERRHGGAHQVSRQREALVRRRHQPRAHSPELNKNELKLS